MPVAPQSTQKQASHNTVVTQLFDCSSQTAVKTRWHGNLQRVGSQRRGVSDQNGWLGTQQAVLLGHLNVTDTYVCKRWKLGGTAHCL